mgnify:CR=1 FL=1
MTKRDNYDNPRNGDDQRDKTEHYDNFRWASMTKRTIMTRGNDQKDNYDNPGHGDDQKGKNRTL